MIRQWWRAALVATMVTSVLGTAALQQPAALITDQQHPGQQLPAALAAGLQYVQKQELTAPDGVSPDLFGYRAALSGDGRVALVGAVGKGAPDGNNPIGAAYVFTTNGSTWTLQQESRWQAG